MEIKIVKPSNSVIDKYGGQFLVMSWVNWLDLIMGDEIIHFGVNYDDPKIVELGTLHMDINGNKLPAGITLLDIFRISLNKMYHDLIEEKLTHETLHIILSKIGEAHSSILLDNIGAEHEISGLEGEQ